MNLGGEAVLIVDLAKLLGIAPDADVDPIYRHVVIVQQDESVLGLLVDRVADVTNVPADAVMPADVRTTLNDCVAGQFEMGGKTVHVLDADSILLEAERVRFADIQQSEQARLDALQS